MSEEYKISKASVETQLKERVQKLEFHKKFIKNQQNVKLQTFSYFNKKNK